MVSSSATSARAADGFTLIEALVASLVLLIGIFGALAVLESSTRLTRTAQREQQAVARAQQDIEEMRTLTYGSLALSANPGPAVVDASESPTSPDAFLSGSCSSGCTLTIANDYRQRSLGNATTAPETVVALNASSPYTARQSVTISGETWTIKRYVTARLDPACSVTVAVVTLNTLCSTSYSKRITVALQPPPGSTSHLTRPVYVSSVVTDPAAPPLAGL